MWGTQAVCRRDIGEIYIDSSYVEFRTGVFTKVKFGLLAPKVTDGLYVYEVPTVRFREIPPCLTRSPSKSTPTSARFAVWSPQTRPHP